MTEHDCTHGDDSRPVAYAERWLTVAKLLLTVIVTLVGLMETLGLL
jgi:hypothetical protein